MNNFQVGTQVGATADFLMNTFSASKKTDAGAFSFENAFESKVSDVKPFESYSDTRGEFDQSFSYDEKPFEQPIRYEEPVARKEEPVRREERVEARREDERPIEDERVEKEPVKEEAKENTEKETSDKEDAEKQEASEKDASEESSDEKKEADADDAAKEKSDAKAEESEEEGGKKAKASDLKDIEIKTDTVEVAEKQETTEDASSTEAVEDEEVEEVATETEAKTVKPEVEIEVDTKVKVESAQQVTDKEAKVDKAEVSVEAETKVVEKAPEVAIKEEIVEEAVGVKSETTDQAKQQNLNTQQAAALKHKPGDEQKKYVRKEDMADRLEKETGVKIDRMSMEKVKTSPDEMAQKTSKDLLKTLDSNRGRFDVKARTLRNDNSNAELNTKEAVTDKPALKLNKLDIAKNFIQNTSNRPRPEAQQQSNNQDSQNSFSNTTKETSNVAREAKVMQQAPTGNSANARNLNNIHDIMNNIKTMLRGADLQAKAKLIMDFQTQGLGQLRMGVLHKNDGIEISIEVRSDSSRQELMKQKDELSEQLKNLGYKFANVDISYGDHQQHEDAKQQMMSGNEDIRNVKLAGDEEADLEEILTMA